jgi:hypothetical protein
MDINTYGLIDSVFFSFFTGGDNPLTSRAPDTLLENSCQITREEIRKLLTHDCTFPLKYLRQFLGELYVEGECPNLPRYVGLPNMYVARVTF